MSWRERSSDETVTEWERGDRHATIRLRERGDGSWAVRLDRLYQAPEGPLYRRETVASRAAATELVERWKDEYDVAE
jgi:hypothetical protein